MKDGLAILAHMTDEEREAYLASLSPEERAALEAQLIASMTAEEREAYLASLSPEDRAKAEACLHLDPNPDPNRVLSEGAIPKTIISCGEISLFGRH